MTNFYSSQTFKKTKYYQNLLASEKTSFDILTNVFHFKTNTYILENLINWEQVPDDPIYRLNFPNKKMLSAKNYELLLDAHQKQDNNLAQTIRDLKSAEVVIDYNLIPQIDNGFIKGAYQAFPNLLFLFPAPMITTCHAYCSYCFRWKQFVDNTLQLNNYYSYSNPYAPIPYLLEHPEITDVLFTGADPLVLPAQVIQKYIAPILDIPTIKVVQLSSKALAWWPYRFTSDKDADNLLRLFDQIVAKNKHLNFLAHFSHARELENEVVKKAIRRIQNTGAVIRCQSPIAEGINDSTEAWVNLWNNQISLGLVPTYMYMESDHNNEANFRIPLAKALNIFQTAQKQTTGLTRTARGPLFMNDIHRILLDGTVEINKEKFFVLKCLQSPYTESEGKIKLIPYDKKTRSAGNLTEMFMPKQNNSIIPSLQPKR